MSNLNNHLNKEADEVLGKINELLEINNQTIATVDHLALCLLNTSTGQNLIKNCSTIPTALADLKKALNDAVATGEAPVENRTKVQVSESLTQVLQYAIAHAKSAGVVVDIPRLFISILDASNSNASFYFENYDISSAKVKKFASSSNSSKNDPKSNNSGSDDESEESSNGESMLKKYAVNLNERAASNQIDPLIGRQEELERTVQILSRRSKNNPLFVGEPGVGKTAVAEGLARRIVEGSVPPILKNSTIWALDLGAMLAGSKFRGDFEKRLKGVTDEIKKDANAILFIDEIHTIIGAGATSGGSMDASNLLKPLLARGQLRCIGSTTFQEFREIFEKDRALSRRFQKIDIVEPTPDETVEILKGLKSRFEEHHGVRYTSEAIEQAVQLSVRYLTDRLLPDKAIDILDEAGASYRVKNYDPGENVKIKVGKIDVNQIESIVAKMARLPSKQVTSSDREQLKDLEGNLKSAVFGQDQAVSMLSDAVKMARSGLNNPDKPLGSFLFVGPTGVGKTEVTKQLASQLGLELVRFDMSEYMESHSVSRLVGAPPGYVGFDKGGLLTEAISKHPHSVLLLDELEKAHPDIFNILLQVMDRGILTDTNGREVNFKNVFIVMTSNAGAQAATRRSIGFTAEDTKTDMMQVVNKTFSPEFRNRLDAIVSFNSLGMNHILTVVDKFLGNLKKQLVEKNVTIEISDEAREWLAKKGFDPQMGARPMERMIQTYIKRPLADELLFGDLKNGGVAHIEMENGELKIRPEAVAVVKLKTPRKNKVSV